MAKRHPLIAELDRLIMQDDRTLAELERTAGIGHRTITNWLRGTREPQLFGFTTALKSLGYELRIAPEEEETR